MHWHLALLVLVGLALGDDSSPNSKPLFVPPKCPKNTYMCLYFSSPSDLSAKLVLSQSKKDSSGGDVLNYDGKWAVEVHQSSAILSDHSLVLKSVAKHHAVSYKLDRPLQFDGNEVVIQYEVKFPDGIDCAGAYVKLLTKSDSLNLVEFNDKTPYTIMFGPDKCGTDEKLHFIIRFLNPKSGAVEEKHAKFPTKSLNSYFSDKKTHLFTLVLRSDNTFQIYIDMDLFFSGNVLEDFQPPILPPKHVEDSNAVKPEDWDERWKIPDPKESKPADWDESLPEEIPDESATKPQGWLDDQPTTIDDPAAVKPADWDAEMDGTWTPPQIPNPACTSAPGCGEWVRPMMKNPDYKGIWAPSLINNPNYNGTWEPPLIDNPHYFEDPTPFHSLEAVDALGLELWSLSKEIVFDNFIITDSKATADQFAKETWVIKKDAEKSADPSAQSVVEAVKETFSEKPWFIALLGLVVALPISLCCYCLCRSGSPPDTAAQRKKTDSPTPDDQAEVDDDNCVLVNGNEEAATASGDNAKDVESADDDGEVSGTEEQQGSGSRENESSSPSTRLRPRKF